MILISSKEAEYLRKHNYGRYINISSKTHKSRAKRYYLTENQRVMSALDSYRKENITAKVE